MKKCSFITTSTQEQTEHFEWNTMYDIMSTQVQTEYFKCKSVSRCMAYWQHGNIETALLMRIIFDAAKYPHTANWAHPSHIHLHRRSWLVCPGPSEQTLWIYCISYLCLKAWHHSFCPFLRSAYLCHLYQWDHSSAWRASPIHSTHWSSRLQEGCHIYQEWWCICIPSGIQTPTQTIDLVPYVVPRYPKWMHEWDRVVDFATSCYHP